MAAGIMVVLVAVAAAGNAHRFCFWRIDNLRISKLLHRVMKELFSLMPGQQKVLCLDLWQEDTPVFLSFLLSSQKTLLYFAPKWVYLNPEDAGLRMDRHQAIVRNKEFLCLTHDRCYPG